MLIRLHVRNYLLIEELDLDLERGLTIITGETGSGKSILIGALGLAMGERADGAAMRDPLMRCIIELEVDLAQLGMEDWFAAHDVPQGAPTILRRQLDPGGRSRAFVNDTPVRLEQLRELGARLVHVHSQHHTLLLNDPRFQLGLVDHVAAVGNGLRDYAARYEAWRTLRQALERLREEVARARSEQDYLQFQLDELEEAGLKPNEQEGIEQDLSRAEHAGELIAALRAMEEGIGGDRAVLALLAMLRQALARPARLDSRVNALLERLNSVHIEVKDIGDEATDLVGSIVLDPADAQRLRDRLDLLLRLQQKHRVGSVEELFAIRDELRERTANIDLLGDRIGAMEAEEAALHSDVKARAKAISALRQKALKPLGDQVADILRDLGMPHAVFLFEHQIGELAPLGVDRIRALFSANKDRSPAPLDKVASGGELSRVMLALISLAADSQGLPTVVFDEIDTGVSGEVADRVGDLLARMGGDRQVLAITHLPQIASKARQHLLVSKGAQGDRVRTAIDPLDMDRRVEAIAQMLSGRKLTKQALENARVLLKGK